MMWVHMLHFRPTSPRGNMPNPGWIVRFYHVAFLLISVTCICGSDGRNINRIHHAITHEVMHDIGRKSSIFAFKRRSGDSIQDLYHQSADINQEILFRYASNKLLCRQLRGIMSVSYTLSLRGGADNQTENNLDDGANGEENGESNEDVSKSIESEQGFERKRTFLSFFRQLSSKPSAAAAVLNTKTSNADKIPHGPTGGGYAPITDESDTSQQDGDLMVMTNEISSDESKTKETRSLSTYPSAFVINQGHNIQSTQELLSLGDQDQLETSSHTLSHMIEDVNSTNNDCTFVHDRNSKESPTTCINEQSNMTIHISNATEGEILELKTTSNAQKVELQNANTSRINISFSASREKNQDYTSSGYWVWIDLISSFGLSSLREDLKISKVLRPVRKAAAQSTGLHGFLSGKPIPVLDSDPNNNEKNRQPTVISIDEELGIHDASASEAEITARQLAKPLTQRQQNRVERRTTNRNRRRWRLRKENNPRVDSEYVVIPVKVLDESPNALERRRRKRVEDIDELLKRGSARLMELQCEKDDLQQAPNPLFNYTKQYDESANKTFGDVRTSREFNFPSSVLVEDYIEELVTSGRLICLNHTDLWQNQLDNDLDDDESVGDDLFTPSADARKLYQNLDQLERGIRRGTKKSNGSTYAQNSGGGSWLLRTGFGNGGSIGEKLGETIETQAYKAVTASVMTVLARILSALHGINVMNHSDIRLYVEDDPDLPPVEKEFGSIGRDNYAQQAIQTVIKKGAKKKRRHGNKSSMHSSSRRHGHELSEAAFIQRDAVVETLISHCQISAPLLKLFPIDWQRAIVGNIITLVTAIISDFADGIQLQILGHSLSFSFKPITEADLFQHIGVGGFRPNHRRSRPDEFEYAVWATAQDISESLSFLGDGWLGWLEKKIGGGILISQLSNLIARLVLTLIDEVLSGARLDMWSSQANGPRLYAALEYRTTKPNQQHESYAN